jgi:hypothetical protein
MGIYATTLWLIGRDGELARIASPEHDKGDLTEVAALIDAPDLLTQRHSFGVEPYVNSGKPGRKPSPGTRAFR